MKRQTSLNLPGGALIIMLPIPTLQPLTPTLSPLQEIAPPLRVVALSLFPECSRMVPTSVTILPVLNGPAIQLLVLSLRLSIPLKALFPVASTTTGIEEAPSTLS